MKSEKLNAADVPAKYLAELLDLTTVRVSQLHTTGVIPNNGTRGRYSLFDAVPAYLDYLRANKGSDAAVQLTLARSKKIELEIDKAKNDLVKTSDAAEVFRVAWTALRDAAMQIPKRVARAEKLRNQFQLRRELTDEIDELLYESERPLREYFGDVWGDPKGK